MLQLKSPLGIHSDLPMLIDYIAFIWWHSIPILTCRLISKLPRHPSYHRNVTYPLHFLLRWNQAFLLITFPSPCVEKVQVSSQNVLARILKRDYNWQHIFWGKKHFWLQWHTHWFSLDIKFLVAAFIPLYCSVTIGIDIRPLQKIEDELDFEIEKGDILSMAIQEKTRSREVIIPVKKIFF